METSNFWRLARIWGRTMLTMESMTFRRETWSMLRVILPLSILLMSSTSLMRPSRCLLERVIFRRQFCTWAGSSMLAVAMAVMPTMAFMGVRMSWDMLERNSLLALLAFSASRRAVSRSAICWRIMRKNMRNTAPRATSRAAHTLKIITLHCRLRRLMALSRVP